MARIYLSPPETAVHTAVTGLVVKPSFACKPGPIFSGQPTDYWVPTNWQSLDSGDTDLGGSGPIVVDVPGATPSTLVVALGKDGNAYLVNRNNLGGITLPVASVSCFWQLNYPSGGDLSHQARHICCFSRQSSTLSAFRITAANPPAITSAWSKTQTGVGSPFVTSTDGTNNVIVWAVGSGGDQRLHGYDGDNGNVIFAGGGPNDTMGGTHSYSTTGIVARGRVYVAGDNRVYAFNLPAGTPTLTPTASPTPILPLQRLLLQLQRLQRLLPLLQRLRQQLLRSHPLLPRLLRLLPLLPLLLQLW